MKKNGRNFNFHTLELEELIIRFKSKYSYLELQDEVFTSMVLTGIENSLKEENFSLEEQIEQVFQTYLKSCFSDLEQKFLIVDRYVCHSIVLPSSYGDCLKSFQFLHDFVLSFEDGCDLELFVRLMEHNSILEFIIDFIVKEKLDLIKQGMIYELFLDDLLASLVEIYCTMHDISILDHGLDEQVKVGSAFELYLADIKNIPALSKLEEVELSRLVRQKDEMARKRLIEGGLRLVVSIAKRYQGRGLSLEDLVQEGNIGLVKAASKYDGQMGYRFSTYATMYIHGFILKGIENYGKNIRIPNYMHSRIINYCRVHDELEGQLKRSVTWGELSLALSMDVSEVQKLDQLQFHTYRLNEHIDYDDGSMMELVDTVVDESESFEVEVDWHCLYEPLMTLFDRAQLDEKQKEIVQLFYGLGKDRPYKLREIVLLLGSTTSNIGGIKDRALKRLRKLKSVSQFYDCIEHSSDDKNYVK